MKHLVIIILAFFSLSSFAQDKEEQDLLALKKANDLVYDANELVDNDDYVSAEMEYRKAISEQPNFAVGTYNLGNSYYKKGNFDEALYRQQQTAKNATSKDEKYRAFHNIGNILMQNKQCQEAAEAFKNALRNNPTDNETRYNYALAKECAEQQQQDQEEENKDQNEEKKEDEKEKEQDKEQQDENKENKPEDEGEQDKKEGEDQKDEDGKPKDEKEDEGKGEQDKKEQPQPQPGQLSPQQIKNLLEAMNDQEQKVQDKVNEQKQKGAKVQTEKDW